LSNFSWPCKKSWVTVWWGGIPYLVTLSLLLPSLSHADSAASLNNRGNRLYGDKKYGEALKLYRDAQLEAPKSPQIHYNAGDALYQGQDFDQAIAAYDKALSLGIPDKGLEARTHYNLGNTYFKKDRFQEAVASYRRALALDPDDRDFKHNMELAMEKLRTQQQAQSRQGNQKQTPQNQDRNNPRSKQDDPDRKQQDQPQQNPQQGQENQPPPRPGDLSRQEAERVLDAVKDQEREAQKKRRVAVTGRRYRGEEW
jgi:Ca-activated chloride channel family protein